MPELYTPEYSNELLDFVQEVYSQDVKRYFSKLKLEKLIDLLEQAESLFETYRELLNKGKYEDCLTAYVIGAFYVFLIIPSSVQFNARNKSYAVYTELRRLYQDEVNTSNVLLMVLHKVDSVLNSNMESMNKYPVDSSRKRAFSVEEPLIRHQMQALNLEDLKESEVSSDDIINSNFASTEWKAPSLCADDRLQLAMTSAKTTESSSINSLHIDEDERKPETKIDEIGPTILKVEQNRLDGLVPKTSMNQVRNIPRHQSLPANRMSKVHNTGESSLMLESMNVLDRSQNHRKDSYHSVYLADELNYDFDDNFSRLSRLQQENTIDCLALFNILNDTARSKSLLLIDLRLPKRFLSNHLIAPNLLNIDPRLLFNSETNSALTSFQELSRLVSNSMLNRIEEFHDIVYYTDNTTFMQYTFNYELILFQLLFQRSDTILPRSLLGGYEQWKVFLNKEVSAHQIDKTLYVYKRSRPGHQEKVTHDRSYKATAHSIPSASESHNTVPISSSTIPPPIPKSAPPPLPPTSPPAENLNGIYSRSRAEIPTYPTHNLRSSELNDIDKNPQKTKTKPVNHGADSHLHAAYTIPTIENSGNEFVSLSITGLRNLGNTCYINSMLQCLFACSQFRDIFLSAKYHRYLTPKAKHSNISKWFSLLFRRMYLNGGCSVVPNGFLKSCHMLRPDLNIPFDQQDTQEFLLFILDTLHDELSEPTMVANDYPNLLLHDNEKLHIDSKEYNKWFDDNLRTNGLSPIDDIFQGQIENSLSCQRCGYTSYSYSSFYVLSLAIPRVSTSKTFSRSKRAIRLEDCINLYTRDELLTGENAWDCPRCGSGSRFAPETKDVDTSLEKKKRRGFLSSYGDRKSRSKFFKLSGSGSSKSSLSPFRNEPPTSEKFTIKSKKLSTIKTLNFITMPNVLVIHLSRFFYDLTKKNETMINYPLILDVLQKNNETARYRLYGIVNHFGNLVSGHYTSLVNKDINHEIRKGKQKWYYFDDEVVKKEVNHGDFDKGITSVSSGDVYVLFYEKVRDL